MMTLPAMKAWTPIAVLLGILAAAVYIAYLGWNLTDVAMPVTGYVALAFGIVFSFIVGGGLMALMFYSSRHGYDEPPAEGFLANRKKSPPAKRKKKRPES
jgi:hypothetical protein